MISQLHPAAPPAPATRLQVPALRSIIWLIPAAYGLHIIEEFTGNFPGWVDHSVHGTFSYTGFVLNNVAFMTILLIVVRLNWRRSSPARATALVVWVSANLFWDALFHLILTPVLGVYSPGLVTAALLYVPLSLLTATAVLTQRILSAPRLVLAVLGGLVVFGMVVWYGLFHFAT